MTSKDVNKIHIEDLRSEPDLQLIFQAIFFSLTDKEKKSIRMVSLGVWGSFLEYGSNCGMKSGRGAGNQSLKWLCFMLFFLFLACIDSEGTGNQGSVRGCRLGVEPATTDCIWTS